MANHRAAAALLLIASLLVAVAVSGADARPAARHSKAKAAALRRAHARHAGHGRHTTPTYAVRRDAHGRMHVLVHKATAAAEVPELTCNKVRGVKADETCFSVAQDAGLSQDQFLGFNPNINCKKLFVGQWVCLDATSLECLPACAWLCVIPTPTPPIMAFKFE